MHSIRKDTGPWARNDKQKADMFTEHLAEIFQPNIMNKNYELDDNINMISEEIPLLTPKEVAQEIKTNLNSKKASGFFLIMEQILKELPRKGIVMLTYLSMQHSD